MCRELRAYTRCTALLGPQGSIWAANPHHIIRTTLPTLMSFKARLGMSSCSVLHLCELYSCISQTPWCHQVSVRWQSTSSTSSHFLLFSLSNVQKSSWWESWLCCLTPAESSLMPWRIIDLSLGSVSKVEGRGILAYGCTHCLHVEKLELEQQLNPRPSRTTSLGC